MTRLGVPLVVLAAVFFVAAPALGQGPFDGEWRAGPRRYQVSVESWGPDCGPRPQSHAGGGGTVQITQSGDHLTFSGAVRGRTNSCWTPNREVSRRSSRLMGSQWQTVCRTGTENPKQEHGVYTFQAAGDTIVFREQTRYDWTLRESRCLATGTSSQTFTRASVAAEPGPEEEPERPACTPGEPARLVIRPARLTVEPGQRQCMRAAVLDAAGCEVTGQPVTWALAGPDTARAELHNGCFQTPSSAAEAEGRFRVTATSGELRADAVVVVSSTDLSDLVARPSLGGSGSGEDGLTARSDDATGLAARGVAGREGGLLWPIVGATSALLVVLGVLLLVMARRRQVVAERASEPPSAPPPAPPPEDGVALRQEAAATRACPVCGAEFGGATRFCPTHGAELSARGERPAADPTGPLQAMICPTCRRGYAGHARHCPHDSAELLPYAMYAARARAAAEGGGERTKICPKCGDRYPLTTQFCGKDGSELTVVS